MHARLVENDMREFRQPVLDVLNPAASDDVFSPAVIRLPERRFIDPIRLLQHALAETVGVEHLHGAAGDAVGLARPPAPGRRPRRPDFASRRRVWMSETPPSCPPGVSPAGPQPTISTSTSSGT